MLRLVGVDPKAEFEEVSSSEDLKLLIARSARGGKLDPGEAGMLSGVFHLHEQEARQVMTPIPAVVTVDVSETAETALRRCVDSGHTRLVVTEDGNTDRIRGIVHDNSLARRLMNEGPERLDRRQRQGRADRARDQAARRPAGRPPARARLDGGRGRRVRPHGRHRHVEDIIEEVVGEIADETDPAVAGVRRLANGDWWVRGHVPITDLADYGLELPVDSEAYNSVGGFVFGELGRLPKRGDMVRVERLLAARRVGAREPRRGGADPRPRARGDEAARPPDAAGRGGRARPRSQGPCREAEPVCPSRRASFSRQVLLVEEVLPGCGASSSATRSAMPCAR